MRPSNVDNNVRPDPDPELVDIANYVCDYQVTSREALDTARNCLMDSLACALMALRFPEAVRHLGPLVPGTVVPNGARVPGTGFSSIRSRRPGTLAPWSAGWTSTIPGWRRNGAILPTIWAPSSDWGITSHARRPVRAGRP